MKMEVKQVAALPKRLEITDLEMIDEVLILPDRGSSTVFGPGQFRCRNDYALRAQSRANFS